MKLIGEYKCGCNGKTGIRVMQEMMEEQIKLGNHPANTIGYSRLTFHSNINITRQKLTGGRIPTIRVHWDFCKDCGREFPFRIESGHATPSGPGQLPLFS